MRAPTGATDLDAMWMDQRDDAIPFVSGEIGAPLIDRDEVFSVDRPSTELALRLTMRGFKSVTGIQYWTSSGEFRNEPDGTLAVADLGRVTKRLRQGFTYIDHAVEIWPPENGWPEVLRRSRLQVTIKRGVDMDDHTKNLRRAVILAIRNFYDGIENIRQMMPFERVMKHWHHKGPPPQFYSEPTRSWRDLLYYDHVWGYGNYYGYHNARY